MAKDLLKFLGKFCWLLTLLIAGCDGEPWNNPYPASEAKANIRYSSFSSLPKTLDPARSYSSDENLLLAQIYEPILQYNYLKRPYTQEPLTAARMPTITYLDKSGHSLPRNSPNVVYTLYDIVLKPGIYYQPHPAFAKNKQGQYYYHSITHKDLKSIRKLSDFKYQGTRELVAEDYVYEIKRLAKPGVNSPIFGLMAPKIVGLRELANNLTKVGLNKRWVDLRQFPLQGVKIFDRYHYQILLHGKYPQFIYWLGIDFFAPIPWEADLFYSQPGMAKKNITFDWYPVGTGPYFLAENNPNKRMVLQKNPFFHPEFYPSEGSPEDKAAGYLLSAGMRLPLIDKVVYTLEKESIPRWIKFLQGYYDASPISSDSFDQAIQIDSKGNPILTPELEKKQIYLQRSLTIGISYIGFNMLDEVVGGDSERARKLRLAISIAVDFQEYINIFLNGRGVSAQGPLPPGIFGFVNGKAGLNDLIFDWVDNTTVRKSLAVAKRLMAEAGYPNGINPQTGEPLILNYDIPTTSGPEEKAILDWIREKFAKIGIQLNIRNTEYNRFQEKMRLGESQIFLWGWIADYPDPENFFFLLYGPNSKAKFGGENAANYQNPEFDQLFEKMKDLPNNQQRQQLINKMLAILYHDAPWVWGVYREDLILNHSWVYPSKISLMTNNVLKYQRINPLLRDQRRREWNQRILWPLGLFILLLLLISLPVFLRYRQKERVSIKK